MYNIGRYESKKKIGILIITHVYGQAGRVPGAGRRAARRAGNGARARHSARRRRIMAFPHLPANLWHKSLAAWLHIELAAAQPK